MIFSNPNLGLVLKLLVFLTHFNVIILDFFELIVSMYIFPHIFIV